MTKVIAKLFNRMEDVDRAVADLKIRGYQAEIIDSSYNIDEGLADADLPPEALDYYRLGISVGGKIIKVTVEDAKTEEANRILLITGCDRLAEKTARRSASPGFARAEKMSATNSIDAQMTGDFRKY